MSDASPVMRTNGGVKRWPRLFCRSNQNGSGDMDAVAELINIAPQGDVGNVLERGLPAMLSIRLV
jgi:hypothetical protein